MAANSAQFPQANDKYVASFGDKGSLALPPARQLIVVTCMDARLDPAAHLGLKEGDAHVIRNAGGAVADALRSIVISQRLLGTREIAIFKHTGCGMLTFTTQQLRDKVVAEQPGDAEVASQVSQIHFHEFPELEGAVKSDVAWLKANPLVLKETTISGWIYEVETGKIRQVV
ncbi:carbonic anhydrase [Auriscalpium vulgare]|uniref:Carbonic anhydrase n=1 Tax=Auriscalpium vulgare TaxID=40419 RepID=A0ACB8RQE8_9AGAM|nr:carbonic anhydrase [Auriscalpium vulgare]